MQSLHRGARDVFHLGHGDEIAQVPQFHSARKGMPSTHAETRNIVFHSLGAAARWFSDENDACQRTLGAPNERTPDRQLGPRNEAVSASRTSLNFSETSCSELGRWPQRNPDIIAGGTRIPVETTIIGRLSGTKGHDRNTDHNYG